MFNSFARPHTWLSQLINWLRFVLPEGRGLSADSWQRRHKTILFLLWAHAIGIFFYSLSLGNSLAHDVFESSIVAAAALLASSTYFKRNVRAIIASLGLLMASSVLVHLSGGTIEMHFHFFVMIPVIALYQNWAAFLFGLGYVVLEHGVLGVLMPRAVYDHADAWANPWKWAAIHGVFVLGASIACIINWRMVEAAAARTEQILNGAGEGIYGVSAGGRITFINTAAALELGWESSELLGRNAHDTFHRPPPGDATADDVCRSCAAVQKDGTYAPGEQTFWRRDGTSIPIEYTIQPLRARAPDPDLVVTFKNVAERKRAEQELRAREAAEAANRAKTEFLSRVSHELRTPLNAILGFAQILEMDGTTPGQQESVDHIMQAGRHLLSLINEVLDIARIEEGQMGVSIEPIPARLVLEECLALSAPLAAQRDITIVERLDGLGDIHVMADWQRLKQVFLNLLSNAVKYNHVGGSITISSEQPNASQLRISIADTGPGIMPEKLARLFIPFDRLDAEQTGVEGTGLGLALSRRLAEAIGGSIGLQSEVGQGSTFWVDLLLAQPLSVAVSQPSSIDYRPALVADDSPCTILQIEDNLANQKLVEAILAQRPHARLISSRSTLDPAQVWALHPDLILLDLHLLERSGQSMFFQLRSNDLTRDIPVIVVSADASQREIEHLLNAGVHTYLTKPLEVGLFLNAIDKVMLARDAALAV